MPEQKSSVGNYRWVVCGLLFFATTVNYMDRQIISLLEPILAKEFNWTQVDYSNIVVGFQLAYAIGLLAMGGIIDRIGVKKGFAFAVILWSVAAAAHGLVRHIPADSRVKLPAMFGGEVLGLTALSVWGFILARFALGVAEAGNFPASIKAVGEWFPKKERALATGIFNSGTNVGALITPLLVPWLVGHWGWAAAFYLTGAVGFVWVAWWWWEYDDQPEKKVSATELAYIRSDPQDPPQKYPWMKLLFRRQTVAFFLGKLITDPFWWFYLFWIPPFLNTQFGVAVDPKKMGLPVLTIYVMASVGAIGGGWFSSMLIKRGRTVNAARKTAMLTCAVCVVPIIFASKVTNMWSAVLLIGLAAAAHQGFSSNIFTMVSDTVPRKAVSSVVGIGGMAGALGGMFIAKLVGYVLYVTHNNYLIPFLMAGFAYLIAVLIIHLFLPKFQEMQMD